MALNALRSLCCLRVWASRCRLGAPRGLVLGRGGQVKAPKPPPKELICPLPGVHSLPRRASPSPPPPAGLIAPFQGGSAHPKEGSLPPLCFNCPPCVLTAPQGDQRPLEAAHRPPEQRPPSCRLGEPHGGSIPPQKGLGSPPPIPPKPSLCSRGGRAAAFIGRATPEGGGGPVRMGVP